MRCLYDFINAQSNYYSNSLKILQDLQKQFSVYGLNTDTNSLANENTLSNQTSLNINNQINGNGQINRQQQATSLKQNSTEFLVGNLNLNTINKPTRKETIQQQQKAVKAKILFDFEAGDENELSVRANEVIVKFIEKN